MDRPITRGVGRNTFHGAYLDNGFVTAELGRLVHGLQDAEGLLSKVRVLFAFASHEEIGRFGSRVLANELRPDVLIAVDVNHDYNAAPGVGSENFPDISMGAGPTLSVGSVASPHLNSAIQRAARAGDIPLQIDVVGRDTGTDAMAAVLASVDCAVASVGIPIRNMHTISELACTDDVIASTHLLLETLRTLGSEGKAAFKHPDLGEAKIVHEAAALASEDKSG